MDTPPKKSGLIFIKAAKNFSFNHLGNQISWFHQYLKHYILKIKLKLCLQSEMVLGPTYLLSRREESHQINYSCHLGAWEGNYPPEPSLKKMEDKK